ncbi:FecR domain-containing protein [Achromobacter arsenitoxydans]|uniref:FecR family protein n=1 Tax=Achromobacter arsenitoxydans SY8 TaxID=477184 RepID=H0F1X4_9BURK|nr:FecR domain-containing protein [Achromobacter arsenitoxydans]EHK67700.1 FecR family protein [Achromobacter arsenitoxydans SY8]
MTADAATDRIVAEAAGWIVRLDHAQDSAALQAWRQWHDADPRHAEVWRRFGHIRQAVPDGARGSGPDLAAARALRVAADFHPRRRALKLLLGGAGAGLLAAAGYQQADRAGWLAAHRTGVGEQRRIALSDDVELMMNTGTALDVSAASSGIDVRLLKGEIMLEGLASAAPLRVITRHGEVSSVRARVAVRLQDGATRVALDQGDAQVRTRENIRSRMQAGDTARYTGSRIVAEDGRAGREFAWAQGVLIADNMPLEAFLAELGRYREGLVRCDDEVAHVRVNGTFRVQQTDRVLEALAAAHNLRLVYRTRYWVNVGRA